MDASALSLDDPTQPPARPGAPVLRLETPAAPDEHTAAADDFVDVVGEPPD